MGVLAKPIPFGDYFLLEKLNTGGMAEVFKAKTFGVEGFERIVAVKKILPSISEDKEFISMFIDEAKIAGQLTHANIAQIYDLGNINDDYYIALEYVAGHDLRVIFDRCVRNSRKLDIACVCYIISKICEGLDYAHNKKDSNGEPMNIIHRDISPQNILLSYEGDCKLIDFGIAKATNKSSATQVGILKGKFSYMSPEQVSGKTNIDRRSDIFALGIVLFEMLTLKRLFLGSSDFETLEKIRKVEVSPPTLYNSDIPEDLEDIVLKALEKDVNQRYQTANELQEALQRFMFRHNLYYTAKDLSEFMHSMFSQEIALEQKKSEFYKELTCDVLAQSKKPSTTPEDETSFYDRQNVPKLSGVQYESAVSANTSGSQSPRQAINAELDEFQPPRDKIVYSQKSAVVAPVSHAENVNDIVSASVTSGKSAAAARRTSIKMDPVIVNKGRETILSGPVYTEKRKSKRAVYITIVAVLMIIIFGLILTLTTNRFGMRNKGMLTFNVTPENVLVSVRINDRHPSENLHGEFGFSNLSTTADTRYVISAPGYKDYSGSIRTDEDGEVLNIVLEKEAPALTIQVPFENAKVLVDSKLVESSEGANNKFEVSLLNPGEHLVEIRADGYKPLIKNVPVVKDRPESKVYMESDFVPSIATLFMRAEPNSTGYKLKSNKTGEILRSGTVDKSGVKIPNLSTDDSYTILVENGSQTLSWNPDRRKKPKEEQVFIINTQPAAPSASAVPAVDSAAPAQAASSVPAQPANTAAVNTAKTATPKPSVPKTTPTTTKTEKPKQEEKKQETASAPSAPAATAAAVEADTPCILQIIGKPPCDLTVNGKASGQTPTKLSNMKAGTYTIECKRDNGSTKQTVTVSPGETKKIKF